jgi:hypothetical protein
MSIILQGSTSGSVTLQEPAVAGTTVLTLPAISGTALVAPTALTVPNTTGTVMVSGNMPAFSAYAGSATSLSGGGFTKVLFDTEEFDTNSNFASSRFTPTVAGYYQINGAVSVGTGTQLVCSINKNGSEYKRGTNVTVSSNQSIVSSVISFNGSTDYVEIFGFSGVTQNTNTGIALVYFNGSMVRAA